MPSKKGFTLIEILIAIASLAVIGGGTVGLLTTSMVSSMRAKETVTANRDIQLIFSRLKNIDFYHLFAVDSRQQNFGLQTRYPYLAVFQEINTILTSSKFERFSVDIVFMRRDSSDANGNGLTSDLIAYRDNNSDNRDDFDPNIRYFDANGDSDYFDTYISGGRTIAEQPDTHLKQVTGKIYKQGRLIAQQTQLISLEQFSGIESPSSEATLKLLVSTPTNSSYLYSLSTPARVGAFNLAITKPYPSTIARFRADTASPLLIAGETDPAAIVSFAVNNSNWLANTTADIVGVFSSQPLNITQQFVEGADQLLVRATKSTFSSPVAPRDLVLDLNPPQVSQMTPTGSVPTLTPFVSAVLTDSPLNVNVSASGIVVDVITMKINNVEVTHNWDSVNSRVVWIDSTTRMSPQVALGTYTVSVEGGDYAGYKTIGSWNFTVSIQDPDNSAPAIAQKSPIGTTNSLLPEISVRVFDNQSGINPSSIILSLDGVVVVNAANVGQRYDPATDFVRYTSSAPFDNGSTHTVQITASHWANSPADTVTSVDNWNFTVNVP